MTVKLQELAIKSDLKVAMRYKNVKTVAMRCKNRCYVKLKGLRTEEELMNSILCYTVDIYC